MKKTELENIRRDRGALVQELEEAGGVFEAGNSLRCPFHDDGHASGSIFRGDDGAWRFKCHGCAVAGDVFDLRARRLRLPLSDVLKQASAGTTHTAQPKPVPVKPPMTFPHIEAIRKKSWPDMRLETLYPYTNPQTEDLELIVGRYRLNADDSKTFRIFRPCAAGFEMLAPEKPWPLYNRARVAASETVVVVEGEKCVHALQELGIVATTSPGGAKNAASADWTPLADKDVWIWPDADAPGLQYGRDVTGILAKLDPAPRLFWVDPGEYELSDGADVVDVLQELQGDIAYKRGVIETLLQQAKPYVSEPATQPPTPEVTAIPAKPRDERLLDIDDLFAIQTDPRDNVLGDNLICAGELCLLIGPPEVGKSGAVNQLIFDIQLGRDMWLETIPIHRSDLRILYLQTENGVSRLQHDIANQLRGCTQEQRTVVRDRFLFSHPGGANALEWDMATIAGAVRYHRPDLVCVDPLGDFLFGIQSENDAVEMRTAIRGLIRACQSFSRKTAVLIVHHARSGKAAAGQAEGWDRGSFSRGSKALTSIARSQINIAPGDAQSESILVSCGKSNNGRPFPAFAVTRNETTGRYEPLPGFDLETWRAEVSGKTPAPKIRPDIVQVFLRPGELKSRHEVRLALVENLGVKRAKSYALIAEAIGENLIEDVGGLLRLVPAAGVEE